MDFLDDILQYTENVIYYRNSYSYVPLLVYSHPFLSLVYSHALWIWLRAESHSDVFSFFRFTY